MKRILYLLVKNPMRLNIKVQESTEMKKLYTIISHEIENNVQRLKMFYAFILGDLAFETQYL